MNDVLAENERGLRIIYGRPEVVETEIERLKSSYVVTSVFFYVVGDHLEVACNLVNQREIRKANLAAMQPQGMMRRQ